MEGQKFSHEWTLFTEEEDKQIKKIYTKDKLKYIHVGPKGYVLPQNFLRCGEECVWKMPLRRTDVFVASFPRSGTTWTQELVWLLSNNLDYEKAKATPLTERFPFLEVFMFLLPEFVAEFTKSCDETAKKALMFNYTPAAHLLAKVPENETRFIKTHLPMSLMPEGALNTKVVYVARDLRDVAVSCYHFFKANAMIGITCDFKTYYKEIFAKNFVNWSPFFEHLKEAWALRDHPNMLFVFYEELSKDLKHAAKKVAKFLGKEYSDEQLEQLCDHLRFDNFQKNKAIDPGDLKSIGILKQDKDNFIRKGKAGGWREFFDEEMSAHAQHWIEEGLRGTDLRFPHQDL